MLKGLSPAELSIAIAVADAIGCVDADRCTRMREKPAHRKRTDPPCDECLEAAVRAIKAIANIELSGTLAH
jgi:hypothetical protein